MVLGKVSVPGVLLIWIIDNSWAGAYRTCSRCGWVCSDVFFLFSLSFLSFFSLSLGDGLVQTEILSRRTVKSKTTNQLTFVKLEAKKM